MIWAEIKSVAFVPSHRLKLFMGFELSCANIVFQILIFGLVGCTFEYNMHHNVYVVTLWLWWKCMFGLRIISNTMIYCFVSTIHLMLNEISNHMFSLEHHVFRCQSPAHPFSSSAEDETSKIGFEGIRHPSSWNVGRLGLCLIEPWSSPLNLNALRQMLWKVNI